MGREHTIRIEAMARGDVASHGLTLGKQLGRAVVAGQDHHLPPLLAGHERCIFQALDGLGHPALA